MCLFYSTEKREIYTHDHILLVCLNLVSLTVGQRLEPLGDRPLRRQVGHKAPNAGLVLIEWVLEGSGQVTRATGLQP